MRSDVHDIEIAVGDVRLQGTLDGPLAAQGVVVFAHGSGSSRFSSRNRFVAQRLHEAGFATLLFDLLTADEEARERYSRHLRFDIDLLAGRLVSATRWVQQHSPVAGLPVGLFGASTGAAAALVAATRVPVAAVVSRGGRPDLAGRLLAQVRAPTLLVVGGDDLLVLDLNRQAFAQLQALKSLEIVPGASHLFEEPGTLDRAAQLAARWFCHYLQDLPAADAATRPLDEEPRHDLSGPARRRD